MLNEAACNRLSVYLSERLNADAVAVRDAHLLSGGTLQANWRLTLDCKAGRFEGSNDVVLRATTGDAIPGSLSRSQEFEALKAVHDAGVTVPEPILACEDTGVVGADFMISRTVPGTTSPSLITRSPDWGGDKDALARRLGSELGRMQTIRPAPDVLPFLSRPAGSNAAAMLESLRAGLAVDDLPRPVLEWGLRWLERHAPESADQVLTHGDFRTGNFMVDAAGLTGILDWELASWGDPHMDMGWFCARFWRYGQDAREAGGLGARRSFYDGYEAETGRALSRSLAQYWEIMACARWAVISIQQLHRHLSGTSPSLELALTGKCTVEAEYEMMRLIRLVEQGEVADA